MDIRPAAARILLPLLMIPLLEGCQGARAERAGRPRPAAAPPAGAARLVLTGELAPARSVTLSVPETPMWSVTLRFLADDGAAVRKGDKVAEFDNSLFSSTLEERRIKAIEAEGELTRAEADARVAEADRLLAVEERKTAVEKARLDASIPAELRSRREHEEKQMALERAVTELKKAETDLSAARASGRADAAIRDLALRRAESDLAASEKGIAALTLHAPADGTFVTGENPRERRKIQTGDVVWPGLTVGRVTQSGELQAEALLHDVDDGRVAPGDAATLVPDAFPDRRLPARVADVWAIAQQLSPDSPRRAFKVVLKITGGDLAGLRAGLSVKVEFGGDETPEAAPSLATARPSDTAVAVRRETFVSSVEMKGTITALDSEPFGPPPVPDTWEYRITTMVPEGTRVKKGQNVLSFDPTKVANMLQEDRAEADSAAREIERREKDLAMRREEIAQKRAEAEARRRKAALKVDVPRELARAIEWKQAHLDLELAGRQIALLSAKAEAAERAARAELANLARKRDRARVGVRALEAVLPKMSIAAPRDGTVVYVPNWRDEKKKPGDVCWRWEKVMDVPDLSRLGVLAEVDEADSGRVAAGQRVVVRLDSDPDLEFGGVVSSVSGTIQRSSPKSPLKVARLKIALDRVDPRMRPGMRVRGRVEVERVPKALVVPEGCLVASSGGPYVFRRAAGRTARVRVAPGRASGGKVEILSGLSEGDVLLEPEGGS